jgi:hypothetical protein
MILTTNIDKEANLRLHTVTGAVEKDAVLARLSEIYSRSDFDPDMNVLWDLREADLSSFSSADIETVRDFVGERWGTGGTSRAALIVSRDVDFGLSRMYQMLLEGYTSSSVQVFRDYDEAFNWITS